VLRPASLSPGFFFSGTGIAAPHKTNCRDGQKRSQALFCASHQSLFRAGAAIQTSKKSDGYNARLAFPERAMSEAPRIIKKYPNRRLYDTANSGYITLADVKQMVLDDLKFQVIDAKSGDDLTRTDPPADHPGGGSRRHADVQLEMLAQMIRFYGSAQQTIMGQYIEQNVKAFLAIRRSCRTRPKQIYGDKMMITPDLWKQFMQMQAPAMQGCSAITSSRARSSSWTCSSGCRTRRGASSPRSRSPISVLRSKTRRTSRTSAERSEAPQQALPSTSFFLRCETGVGAL
jgi:polyhydroxyalkanoate synthesis repressor PhaR